ncbi:MAG TPA: hypothetical protein VF525_03710 [Pyrinomonadaceae bacterium]|jgi:hypothetical protein
MYFFTSWAVAPNFSKRVVCLLTLCIVFAECFSLVVRAQERVVNISYGKLVDGSQLTHSGATVKAILERLGQLPNVRTPASVDVEEDLDTLTKKAKAFDRRQQEYRRRLQAYQQRIANLKDQAARGTATWASLEAAQKENAALHRLEAQLMQEGTQIEAEMARLKPLAESYGVYRASLALQSEVEPFLEPYAFLLEDALETSDAEKAKRQLIDVGTLFPAGEPQPAWANLVRTRRYYVLSDGAGFVRLFIPGTSPRQAYEEHYGVLRHVLNWLLRSSSAQGSSQLKVEVFAYENDFPTQTLRLHAELHNMVVRAPLSTLAGTAPLDLVAMEQFLGKGRMLEGAYINDAGSLVLYGSERQRKPTLEGQPVSLADFAAAYRAVFYAGHGDAYISLDPSPYPEQVNVNFGGRLADTRLGWVVLRSDMRFKTLSDDFDPEIGIRRAEELRRKLPDFLTQQERRISSPSEKTPEFEATRFWFYPDSVSVSQSADQKFMRITSPRFTGAAERQEASAGDKQLSDKTPPWTSKTLDHLNRNYAAFAKSFPELDELDNVGTLLALFTWLQQQQKAGGARLDLDALLDVELPRCSTPRRRPQMIVGYIKMGTRVEPVDFSWVAEEMAASRPAGQEQVAASAEERKEAENGIFERVSEILLFQSLEKSTGSQPAGTSINGGIDLGMRKVIKRPKPLPPSDQALYARLKQATPEARVTTPSKVFARSEARPPQAIEPYRASAPIEHRILAPEPTTAGQPAAARSEVSRTQYELLTYGQQGKTMWVRLSEQNPLGLAPSKTVHLGDDGAVVAFTRFEQGQPQHYRFAKSGDVLVAEPAPRSARTAEDVALVNTALREETPTRAWRHLPEDTNITAIEKTKDGRTAILEDLSDGNHKLTYYGADGSPSESFTGRRALGELEDIARDNVSGGGRGPNGPNGPSGPTNTGGAPGAGGGGGGDGGGPNKLSFMYASEDSDNIRLTIGSRKKDVSAAKMEEFLSDPMSKNSTVLDDVLRPEGGGAGEFVVYRDALTRRPERFGGSLKAGRTDDPMRLAVALRERYPELKIYLDDEVEIAARNQKLLAPLRRPADLGVLAPEESFSVTDHDLVKKIKDTLNAAGIRVFSTAEGTRGVPNILLISGHNDANLVTYLTSLGEQGLLKDKVLILNTCYAVDNPNLAHHLIQRYGARGIYLHTETIRPVALQPVMDQLGVVLKEVESSGAAVHPSELLDRAIDRVLLDKSLSPRLKSEVMKLKRGVLQISSAVSPGSDERLAG